MKWLFAIAFILILVHYGHQQQQAAQLFGENDADSKECIKSSGADEAVVTKFFSDGKLPDDKNVKCFLLCIMVKDGEMTDAGVIMPDVMKAHADPGITPAQNAQVVDACKNATGTDPCDIAYQFTKCALDQVVKILTPQ